MATYRVGADGAVVFDEGGHAIATLRPGYVVVPGSLKTPGSLADQHQKRQQGYADKMIRPTQTKATPARRPDPRLSNCVLEGGRSKTYPPAEDKTL